MLTFRKDYPRVPTQRDIRDETHLPLGTVNRRLRELARKGFIRMRTTRAYQLSHREAASLKKALKSGLAGEDPDFVRVFGAESWRATNKDVAEFHQFLEQATAKQSERNRKYWQALMKLTDLESSES